MRPAALLCTLLVLPPVGAAVRAGDKDPSQRESLEEFLARARARQQEIQQRLAADVAALVKELEGDDRLPAPKALAATVERIVALGGEATPMLVRYLDPGSAPLEKERVRAQQMAVALAQMDTSPVTDALLEMLARGSNDAKRNALRVLQTSPEHARVRPPIEALFRAAEGSVRQAALRTLLAMGGPENDALLAEVLANSDENLVALAINGLADAKNAAAADQVRKILQSPNAGPRHVVPLLAYFRAVPSALKDQDTLAFVRIAQSSALPLETRVTVIDELARFQPKLDSELRKNMEPLTAATDRRLRDAALVLLTRAGDKGARRELIKEADDVVAKNQNWADAYVRRADVYARIGDDDAAIKDYREALSVGRDDPTLQPTVYEKLARALTRKGKLKDAAETLNRAPLSLAQLQALADDPEFAPLRDSKYGKEAFGLK